MVCVGHKNRTFTSLGVVVFCQCAQDLISVLTGAFSLLANTIATGVTIASTVTLAIQIYTSIAFSGLAKVHQHCRFASISTNALSTLTHRFSAVVTGQPTAPTVGLVGVKRCVGHAST